MHTMEYDYTHPHFPISDPYLPQVVQSQSFLVLIYVCICIQADIAAVFVPQCEYAFCTLCDVP